VWVVGTGAEKKKGGCCVDCYLDGRGEDERMCGGIGVNGEEGERVPLRTLTHVLQLCRPDSIGLA
jgi:hypothetical protein